VPGTPARGERLARRETLRRSADFQRCYRGGARLSGALVTLHYHPNELGHPRLGATVSRRVGSAVVRNRLKRRTREIYRRWPGRSELPAFDLVAHFKPAARECDHARLRRELERLFGEAARRHGARAREAD
jgi:ribonuclease P protein component